MLRQTTLLPYLPVKDKNGMVLKTSLQLIMVNIKWDICILKKKSIFNHLVLPPFPTDPKSHSEIVLERNVTNARTEHLNHSMIH